jgi:hypothetical protein
LTRLGVEEVIAFLDYATGMTSLLEAGVTMEHVPITGVRQHRHTGFVLSTVVVELTRSVRVVAQVLAGVSVSPEVIPVTEA